MRKSLLKLTEIHHSQSYSKAKIIADSSAGILSRKPNELCTSLICVLQIFFRTCAWITVNILLGHRDRMGIDHQRHHINRIHSYNM